MSELKSLSLAGNRLDNEACKALASLFAGAPSLESLNISSTGAEYTQIKKAEHLTSLDISGNKLTTKDNKHLELVQFLKLAPQLKKLSMGDTPLPPTVFQVRRESCHSGVCLY